MKPFYGGFLSKKYTGLCYLRCVRLGEKGYYVHIAPICCLKMHVEPEEEYITKDGIELRLEGGKRLRGVLYCDRNVKVKICRVNRPMRLNFSESLLSSDIGQYEFSWKPSAVERGVIVFGKITGEEIVKTFGLTGNPYILSDITHASNGIILEVEWGKLRKKKITVPIKVFG